MSQIESNDKAYAFAEIFRAELQDILESRQQRLDQSPDPATQEQLKENDSDPTKVANNLQLMGLAFSGGGIRSATFNLGILQALAEMKLLCYFDYLSTVSGGGYIGGWLSAWVTRESGTPGTPKEERGIRKVEKVLAESADEKPHNEEPPQITFLRRYSNYLTPRSSFFSGDTWTSISTYARNSFLMLLLLVFSLSAGLLIPRWLPSFSSFLTDKVTEGQTSAIVAVAILAFVLLAVAMAFINKNLDSVADGIARGESYPPYTNAPVIQCLIVLPVLITAWLASALLGLGNPLANRSPIPIALSWMLAVGILYTALCIVSWLFGGVLFRIFSALFRLDQTAARPRQKASSHDFKQLPWIFVAGAVGGLLVSGLVACLNSANLPADVKPGLVITWGPPILILLALIIVTLHVGFVCRQFKSEMHEWWLRLGGWLSIYGFAWIALFGMVLYGPLLIYHLESAWVRSGLTLTWLLTTIGGVLAGRSPATGPKGSNPLLDWIAKIAPYVFVVGLVVLLALGMDVVLRGGWPERLQDTAESLETRYWGDVTRSGQEAFFAWLLSVGLAGLLAWRFDINLFSLHYYYRNRLIRCYLGATRGTESDEQGERQPQPFTGFDPNDDYKLAHLRTDIGPYPIINAALNLVAGDELAWQQRKAAPFIFTPKFCGYDVWNREHVGDELEPEAYRSTACYADGHRTAGPGADGPEVGGPSLGTAIAVSGAAFSPNMGYHTSPAVSFLLTVFSMRLGLWAGNPRHKKGWRQQGPLFALGPLLAELFGLTNERRRFCNLSDGGHFEVLGIYELVRRRCRFIVAIDASEDEEFSFKELGNTIHKCRVDLKTEISIGVKALHPVPETKLSARHCAVGTIHYPDGSLGTLVYIKPTLTGNESADILNYAHKHADFPHQSTNDQWFDESQFESYRKLGYHVGRTVFKKALEQVTHTSFANPAPKHADTDGAQAGPLDDDKTSFFLTLRQLWYPASPSTGKSFTRHAEVLDGLYERLRQSKNLQFLDFQIYPEWESLTEQTTDKATVRPTPIQCGLPKEYEALREGFYFCNSLIQLMENVYLDLNLEEEWDHPDNRGWMNLFRHWSWADMVRATWAISVYTYGARFQNFCQQRLGLRLGEIKIEPLELKNIRKASLAADLKQGLTEADEQKKLNFVETDLIHSIVTAKSNGIEQPNLLKIILLRMQVPGAPGDAHLLAFTFGFALLYKDKLGFFRVQDHLRKTGLGGRALRSLLRDDLARGIRKCEVFEVPKDDIREIPKQKDVEHIKELFRLYRSQ